jgi:prepilin-type N-terminal cleavage/methylation domain-containing protein
MKKGFTLVELLVVIAVISVLAAIVLASLSNARAKSRDAIRLSDVRQIQTALELYKLDHGQYPLSGPAYDNSSACADWFSIGNQDAPHGLFNIPSGQPFAPKYMPVYPRDPSATGCFSKGPLNYGSGYLYFRYQGGDWGTLCGGKTFYVLIVTDFETVNGLHPSNPGFVCGGTNFNDFGDWVVGKFE